MSIYEPTKEHLRHSMLLLFNLKKTAAKTCILLKEAYGDHAPSADTCERWYKRFKTGDYDLKDRERLGQPKKFTDTELEDILIQDNSQTQKQIATQLGVCQQAISDRLHAIGKIQVEGKWMPHELSERSIERRKTVCEILLERYRRKTFLHRIVTSRVSGKPRFSVLDFG